MAQARGWAHRRTQLAAVALVASSLLVGCGLTRVTAGEARPELEAAQVPAGDGVFAVATPGDCLAWPDQRPAEARLVDCAAEHRFEVSEILDLTLQYGPNAEPPTVARIQQLTAERCEPAARHYLGAKFDPDGRFTVTMLWSGERAWERGGRRMLCGLQLTGRDQRPQSFTGKVVDLDQSRVWPAGTCLGIDTATSQPTDVPVDCAAPHAFEVTGTVDVGARFPGHVPAELAQDDFIKDACTRITDAYLAPIGLRETTLTIAYTVIQQASWDAGSRRVACNIGAHSGGSWSTLLNSAKGPLLIDGRPPAP